MSTHEQTEMEACLDAAANAADTAHGRWQETAGPDSGVGIDTNSG